MPKSECTQEKNFILLSDSTHILRLNQIILGTTDIFSLPIIHINQSTKSNQFWYFIYQCTKCIDDELL